jgi:serine/threonine protein kinase
MSWVVPGYTEEKPLGRGASGRVVAAVHDASGQRVAIKYLAPKLFKDPEFLTGFRAEADLLRSLDVPHVVRLFDYVEAPGEGAAIIMELVDGVSLHEMISRRGATSAEAALVVLKGSLLGLASAHALGIVHRDYKPENVLVDAEGNSKLSDFGVAVKEGRAVPAAGTPLYMSPEQWDGQPPSPATDIYAATAVFFECLTGKTPFSGRVNQLAAQHAAAAVPVELVDEPLRGLVERGMAKNPAFRPRDAMAFVAELESTADAAYGPDWESRGKSHLKERAAALLLLLLGTGAIAGGAGAAGAGTWLVAHKAAAITIAAFVTAVVVGVAATALTGGFSGGSHSTIGLSASNGPTSPASSSSSGPGPSASATQSSGGTGTGTFTAMANASPPVAASQCTTPTTFTFSADLTSTGAGTVSYKWVYSTGKSGAVQTTSFVSAGTQQVSGGTVQTKTAGSGWAAIQLVSPSTARSNEATYKLTCTTTAVGTIGLSAFVSPATQKVACTAAPPSVTFTGLISDTKAGSVTYHWALSNGATSPPATLTFTGAGTQAVQPLSVTAPGTTANGSGMLVITSPATLTSSQAFYSVTCSTTAPPPPPVLHLSAAAAVSPGMDTVSCTAAAPTFTFTGSITANQATTVSYHWALPSGNGPAHTLTFGKAGTLAVAPATFTPGSDTASGSGTIVITGPMAAASGAATFALKCTTPNISVSISSDPPSGTSVSCNSTPPPFTFTGTISSDQAVSGMHFTWSGLAGGSGTVSVAAGGSVDVSAHFTPSSDSFSGTETLDITSPFAESQTLPITMSCSFPPLQVSANLPTGSAGVPYSGSASATGGDGHYSFSASGLPGGLTMSSSGVVSGTPDATDAPTNSSQTYMVTVMVSDGESSPMSTSATFALTIDGEVLQAWVTGPGSAPGSATGGSTLASVIISGDVAILGETGAAPTRWA